jgi:MoaA/NifB/PqqE/SkfB family radical SAM enzyme
MRNQYTKTDIVPYVVNDFVIKEDSCNLSCEYCLTGQSQFKEDHSLQLIFNPPTPTSCLPGTEMHSRIQRVLNEIDTQSIPVVKISGGEVMLVRGIMELIEDLSARYETVVLLTNGLLLTDAKLQKLIDLGNVVLQLSLDATRYAGNSYRVTLQKIQDALMARFDHILRCGLDVEIYTVINNRSILALEETVQDLLPYADTTTIFPFPVRGPTRGPFFPTTDQIQHLRPLLDKYDEYAAILPSYLYLQRLWRFFTEEGRTFGCHLPRIAFTSFDDGVVTSCPNIWFNNAGNVLEKPASEIFPDMANSGFRQLLLAEKPRIDACKACFTPWDPVSLYFEDQLTLEEVARIPIYRGRHTQARLAEIRNAYRAERNRKLTNIAANCEEAKVNHALDYRAIA